MDDYISDYQTTHVRGDLLRWARLQQSFTLRQVERMGGPSASYQNEIEHGRKHEISSKKLAPWVKILQVTESFARGQVPSFLDHPEACRGFAVYVYSFLMANHAELQRLATLTPDGRAREVLHLIGGRSAHLPRVVLAHVLGLSVKTLEALLTGEHPIMKEHLNALQALTTLPLSFFVSGELQTDIVEQFRSVILRAHEAGIRPADMLRRLGL